MKKIFSKVAEEKSPFIYDATDIANFIFTLIVEDDKNNNMLKHLPYQRFKR